ILIAPVFCTQKSVAVELIAMAEKLGAVTYIDAPVGTMEQIERQQRRLSAASATSDALKANRMALYGQGIEAY
ncbi:hypothetical protein, partial [Escherichia coli]|uniref:hypothetical protein n=1 Tax=Escherichia coli TaxID=562 RepID=UPI001ADB419A